MLAQAVLTVQSTAREPRKIDFVRVRPNLSLQHQHIIEQSDYGKKINNTNLKFAEKIYEGVTENLDDINKVLKVSMSKKVKINNMDKLLISIFRSAIYEILFSNDASKKIVISEYLLIANRFFGNNETALINGVLDNLQNS